MKKHSSRNYSETKTILVAEDDQDTRSMLRFSLEKNGYKVVEATNGNEAVNLAQAEKPDLILTDLRMPEVDGVDAIRQIRAVERLREVPILAMSADGRSGMELFLNIEQLGSGFIDYITKPFNLDSVLEQVNELMSAPA